MHVHSRVSRCRRHHSITHVVQHLPSWDVLPRWAGVHRVRHWHLLDRHRADQQLYLPVVSCWIVLLVSLRKPRGMPAGKLLSCFVDHAEPLPRRLVLQQQRCGHPLPRGVLMLNWVYCARRMSSRDLVHWKQHGAIRVPSRQLLQLRLITRDMPPELFLR